MSLALVTACAPIFAADPKYATDSGARPQGQPETTSAAPAGPPPIEAPKNDLSWSDCTARLFGEASVTPVPGITLDCATYDADLDPIDGANGTLNIGVVRARSPQTPADAGPLVMTTGSDLPSSVQLPEWLSRSGTDILKTHPVVAVDRRGIGLSDALDCRDIYDRQEMLEQAQFQAGDDPVANLGAVTMTATTSCTDTIAPGDSAYDNAHAAEDLERLRSTWDVPALALLGVGNGAQVALAYAGSHPNKVSRLILDSPLPLAIGAEAAAEQRIKGQQASLDAFAAQCIAINCPLAPDPKGAVDSLLSDARAGRGPGGASVATLTNAIVTALGFPRGDRIAATNDLAAALAAARSGDATPINTLITQADSLRQTDGQFVNSCSDALNRPTPTGSASSWWSGASSIPSSVPSVRSTWSNASTGPAARPPRIPRISRFRCCCSACRTIRSWATRAPARSPRPSSTPARPTGGSCGRASATAPASTRRARCRP